jgi:hypothetical protein
MLKSLSPTLLSLVLGISTWSSPLWSATAEEREQHAIAVAKLMTSKMRHPAERQLKDYHEAGYPKSDPYLDKVLRYTYLDQFTTDLAEADKPKHEAELKALRAELEPALKAGKLSGAAKQIFSGGGGSATRMVNEIARIMHPEAPAPLVPLASEKIQVLARLFEALGKQAEEDFKAAVEKVKANKAAEDKIWDLPEGGKEFGDAVNQGVEVRLEALRPLYVAMIALRDGANRGVDFGLDPAPIQAQIKKIFATERPEQLEKGKTWTDLISQWDFEWGEFNPVVRLNCGTLLGDAVVAGVKSAKEEEVEGILQAVADFNAKEFKDANMRAEAYRLKLQGWQSLLRYRLIQNNTRAFNRGWAAWQDLQNRAKSDDFLRLNTIPTRINGELGKLYLTAARLAHAKGDASTANGLMAELAGAKPANPYAHYAKSWMAYWGSSGGGGASGWSQRPLAMGPEKALIIARAFMSEANATADPQVARQNLLSAAVALRNGVLGLQSGLVDDKGFVEFAPQTYHLYAYVLSKLDLRHHAVVAAQDGARAVLAKMKWYADQKKPNPWKKPAADGKTVWDESRMTPLRLANDGMIFASNLKSRDPNTTSLYNQSIELLKEIDADAVGPNLIKRQVLGLMEEREYESALREADNFQRQYPDQYLWVFTAKNSITAQWLDKLARDDDKAKIVSLSEQLTKDNAVMAKRIEEELKKTDLAPERRRELERARTTIKVSEVDNLMANKKYEDVIKRIDAEAIRNLPSEESLAARLLRQLARATFEWHEARKDALAKDPALLLSALKTYEGVYQNLDRGIGKLRNKGVDGTLDAASQMLAIVFNRSVTMISRLQQAGNANAELVAMAETANRAFADLYEPTIDDKTKVDNVLFIARTLWEVDEHARAAKQFARFLDLAAKDPAVQDFRSNPKGVTEKAGAVVTTRGEFRKPWDEIADLAWDSPEDKQAYETLPRDRWPTRARRDLPQALNKLAEFRKLLASNKSVIAPEQFKQIEAAVGEFQNVLATVASMTMAKSRLAAYYRESNQFDQALPLLMELYEEDKLSLDNQMALVLVTYNAALKGDPMPPKEELLKARGVVADIRNATAGSTNKIGYWEAYTLVLEFSVMLGDMKVVNEALSFMRRNRSDLSRDLVAPPVWGDDKRIRRPMNALAAQLAQRFLSLYEKQGVTEKPAFKLTEIEVGGEKQVLFTDPDAPAFTAKPMTTPDDDEVIAFVAADGSTPPPVKPEPPRPAEPREDPADAKPAAPPAATTPADAKPAESK